MAPEYQRPVNSSSLFLCDGVLTTCTSSLGEVYIRLTHVLARVIPVNMPLQEGPNFLPRVSSRPFFFFFIILGSCFVSPTFAAFMARCVLKEKPRRNLSLNSFFVVPQSNG